MRGNTNKRVDHSLINSPVVLTVLCCLRGVAMVATGMDASGCCNKGKQRKNNQRIIKIRRDYDTLKILTSTIIIYSGELILSGNYNNEAAAHCSTQIIQYYLSKTPARWSMRSRRGLKSHLQGWSINSYCRKSK